MRHNVQAWFRRRDNYDLLAMLFLAVCLVLICVNLSMYPVYLDIPYHMAVTRGFQEAGGVTTWDFWDYAPAGRPHIYPPLLHLFMSLMLDVGMSMETVAVTVCLIMFPLILLSLWWAMRVLFGSRTAFYSLVLIGVPYVFFWQTGVTVAASLVLALTPLVFLMLEKDRKAAAVVLLAFCLYSHLVMGHLVALALFIYLLHRRDAWKKILMVLCLAYLLYLPWGINVLCNLSSLSLSEPGAGGAFTLHLLLWGLAVTGLVLCYRRKGRYYLLPAYLLSMVPIVFFYPNRFWDGHVFLPLAMLGGVALDRLHTFLKRSFSRRASSTAYARFVAGAALAALLLLVFCVDPVIASPPEPLIDNRLDQLGNTLPYAQPRAGGKEAARPVLRKLTALRDDSVSLCLQPTTFMVLSGLESPRRNIGGGQQVFGVENEALMRAVEENSESGDIVYVRDGRQGDLIYAMTGRYSMQGMFHEVQPQDKQNPTISADVAILPAPPGLGTGGDLESQDIWKSGGAEWRQVAEVGRFIIFVNDDGGSPGGAAGGVTLPMWIAYALLAMALGVIALDLGRGWPRSGPADEPSHASYIRRPPGDESGGGGSVLAIVPACNEKDSVGWVVRDIRVTYPWMDVLVIDDGSRDDTGEEALRAGATVLRMHENVGVGEAVRRGLDHACHEGYQYTVRLDGDGQHPATFIHRLLLPLYKGEAEVVVGSRFLGGKSAGYDIPRTRRLGMAYFRILLRWGTSRRFSDPTSGFQAYSHRAMDYISQHRPSRYPEVTSLHLLAKSHFSIKEVGVEMTPRLQGKSTLSGWQGLIMAIGVTLDFLGAAVKPQRSLRDEWEASTMPAISGSSSRRQVTRDGAGPLALTHSTYTVPGE